jgi:hypothetical protein
MSEQKTAKLPELLPYERITATSRLKSSELRELSHALWIEQRGEGVAVIVPAAWYSEVVEMLKVAWS